MSSLKLFLYRKFLVGNFSKKNGYNLFLIGDLICTQCGASSKVVPFVAEWELCLKCFNTVRFTGYSTPEQSSIYYPKTTPSNLSMNWPNQSMSMGVSPGAWTQAGTPWQFYTPNPKFNPHHKNT